MPKGPQGQKRKADVIGNAVLVMKIATGVVEEKVRKPARAKGAKARAKALSPKQRSEITRTAAI